MVAQWAVTACDPSILYKHQVGVPTAPLLIQLPANAPEKVTRWP